MSQWGMRHCPFVPGAFEAHGKAVKVAINFLMLPSLPTTDQQTRDHDSFHEPARDGALLSEVTRIVKLYKLSSMVATQS